VLAELRTRQRWLLIFDNAEPDMIMAWLPTVGGQVLITARTGGWTETAMPVEVNVLDRQESVAMLQAWGVRGLDRAPADRLAAALGDLPLAVAQAASYLAKTGTTAAVVPRTTSHEIARYKAYATHPGRR
jgi:hypothetical protein